jgi:hypothetical protein
MFRRLMLESLETRRVLAGNVTATIQGDELRIVGDNDANWVQIHQIPGADGTGRTFVIEGKAFAGNYDAQGQPVSDGAMTKINGGTQAVVRTTSQDVARCFMGMGNDVVEIGTDAATGNARTLAVATGDGRDFVHIQHFNVYGDAQPLVVFTGDENDFVTDTVQLEAVKVIRQGLEITTGSGADHVQLQNVTVAGYTEINLGKGPDTVVADGLSSDSALIRGGDSTHRDVVTLSNSQFNYLTARLQEGNDLLNLNQNVKVAKTLTADGGPGTDELHVGDGVTWGHLSKIGIESNS